MRPTLAIVAALALAVAACGGGAGPSPSAAAPSAAPPTSEPSDAPSSEPSAAGAVTVNVATSSLGEILVDGEGRTLYLFTPDEAGEPTCYDACAAAWPPLVGGTATAGTGVTAALTTVARTDGSQQVKAGTWPLYYFASDTAPGDTNGQGVGGNWFVVSPGGEPIR